VPRAFSLVELLVVIAIVAVLLSILLPTLGSAREAGRQAVCLSNLRQAFAACRLYANDHDGHGPAIGVPWGEIPFWALVVQEYAGQAGEGTEKYAADSVLVCPTIQRFYPQEMTRTYAMNATGHAGLTPEDAPPDPDDYDVERAHIDFDALFAPSRTPLLVDSAIAFIPDGAPPPTRTSSVIDFRQEDHVAERLGRFHARESFDAAMLDGSARSLVEVADKWEEPLP